MAGDALGQFQAGQARHLDVGDQHLRLQPLQLAPRALAVGHRTDDLDVRLHAQQRGQRAADHGLVFGQQDADHRRWRGVSVMARR